MWMPKGLRAKLHRTGLYRVRKKVRLFSNTKNWSNRYLLPGHVWLDMVDIVITTKCNLRCSNCSHLIPYYKKPEDLDKNMIIASMRKLNESFDWCNYYSVLGGEPFLDPDLKYILEEVPRQKCNVLQIETNGMAPIPDDPELFDVIRRKHIHVTFTEYPGNHNSIKQFSAVLDKENIPYSVQRPQWTDFGPPIDQKRGPKELLQQFIACQSRTMSVLNGKLYYCFRCAHLCDLGFCGPDKGAIDLLHNSARQNRRAIRKMIGRCRPLVSCQYCLRGTAENVKIDRGGKIE